jgi:hypothetical protein
LPLLFLTGSFNLNTPTAKRKKDGAIERYRGILAEG